MSTELLFAKRCDGGVAWIVDVGHGDMTPEDYTKLYARFCRLANIDTRRSVIEMHTLYPDQHRWGVWWSEHQQPNGCGFTLIVEPRTAHASYAHVKRELRNQRDVTSFKTLRVTKLLEGSKFPTPTRK